MAAYRQDEGPLKGVAEWTVEDGVLVRRSGKGEARWPLADLTRFTLLRRVNRYGADLRMAQLKFGKLNAGFTSQSLHGLGRPQDQTPQFAAFVRALAVEAAEQAPAARFETGASAVLAGGGLWWIVGLLGAGTAAMAAMGFSAGMWRIGVDWSARLLFVLILLFAAAPWLPGRASLTFDPRAIPKALAGD